MALTSGVRVARAGCSAAARSAQGGARGASRSREPRRAPRLPSRTAGQGRGGMAREGRGGVPEEKLLSRGKRRRRGRGKRRRVARRQKGRSHAPDARSAAALPALAARRIPHLADDSKAAGNRAHGVSAKLCPGLDQPPSVIHTSVPGEAAAARVPGGTGVRTQRGRWGAAGSSLFAPLTLPARRRALPSPSPGGATDAVSRRRRGRRAAVPQTKGCRDAGLVRRKPSKHAPAERAPLH